MPEVDDGTRTSGNPKGETHLLEQGRKATPPPRAFTLCHLGESHSRRAVRRPIRARW